MADPLPWLRAKGLDQIAKAIEDRENEFRSVVARSEFQAEMRQLGSWLYAAASTPKGDAE